MSRTPKPWNHYSARADEFAKRYESVSFEQVHASWHHLIPEAPGIVLDVGAGSGRDAAYLADRGWEVIAAEPAARLREEARTRHPSARIRWLDDSLPSLEPTHALDLRFDLILLSAVWMHLPPSQRPRAFRELAKLLEPGALLVISLRHGEPDKSRGQHPADPAELADLAREFALEPIALPNPETDDMLGRPDIHWTTHVFRLPDDVPSGHASWACRRERR